MNPDTINQLGFSFDKAMDVQGRLSIADLFPKSKSRCGIYLLKFDDNSFYIGQTVDTVKRFAQHRKNHNNISQFWFQKIPKQKLDEVERRLIYQADASGLLLTNRVHISAVVGITDLDTIISRTEQEDWLNKNIQLPDSNFDLYATVSVNHIRKFTQNFERLSLLANYPQLNRILNLYIRQCLPAFKKTELSFWSLSCMPGTNSTTFPRYCCLSVNAMEVFVMGYERTSKNPFAFFILTSRFLHSNAEIERLYTRYKRLEAENSDYKAAGWDQIRFHFSDLDELEDILRTEPAVVTSIKELNLRLMRKGGTIYSPFHCFDLAKDVLARGET